jgi:hypothetical protein
MVGFKSAINASEGLYSCLQYKNSTREERSEREKLKVWPLLIDYSVWSPKI